MSSGLGRLAVGVAGGLIGGLFTAGAFSPIGFAVAQMLTAPKAPGIELQKLRLSKTDPGTYLPLAYGGILPGENRGGIRSAGVFIDCSAAGGIKSKAGDAGGGTSGSPKEPEAQKNFLTCAMAYADARVAGMIVDEIYFDEECRFKRSGETQKKRGWANGLVAETAPDGEIICEIGLRVELHRGTWKQQVSPRLQQLHAGKPVPAYRGIALIVFKNVQISTIPTITVVFRNDITNCRTIVRSHARIGGVPNDRLNLTAIEGDVRACIQNSEGGAQTLISQVTNYAGCELAEFDAQIHDYSLSVSPAAFVQVPRGDTATRVANDESSSDDTTRVKESIDNNLPPSYQGLRFIDIERNYEINEAGANRANAGYNKIETTEVGIVSTLDEMLPRAKILLNQKWLERDSTEIKLPWKYLNVAPGNVLEVAGDTFEPGAASSIFMVKSQSLGRVLTLKGVSYDPTLFERQKITVAPQIPVVDVDGYDAPTLFLADPPALNDTEFSMTEGRFIAAASAEGSWAGANIIFNPTTQPLSSNPFGALLGKLVPQHALPTRAILGKLLDEIPKLRPDFDYDHKVRVQFVNLDDDLASCSEQDVLLGANRALIKDTIGNGRLRGNKNGARALQFTTATQLTTTPNVWELGGLWAGRFGTEYIEYSPVGAQFLLIHDENGQQARGLSRVTVPKLLCDLQVPQPYLVTSSNSEGGRSTTQSITCYGNSLEPLGPSLRDATFAANGALTLKFNRRVRTGGDVYWRNAKEAQAADYWGFSIEIVNSNNDLLHDDNVIKSTQFTFSAGQVANWRAQTGGKIRGFVSQDSGLWLQFEVI